MGLPFPNSVQESETMLTGDEIRRARQRAGWSQGVLAEKVGSAMRTVVNWETGKTAPSQKETVIRAALSGYWDADVHQSVPLASASDIELLGEIARRLGRSQATDKGEKVGHHNDTSMYQAGESPADDDGADELAVRRKVPHRKRRPGHDPEWDMLYTDQRAATEGDPALSKDQISDDST